MAIGRTAFTNSHTGEVSFLPLPPVGKTTRGIRFNPALITPSPVVHVPNIPVLSAPTLINFTVEFTSKINSGTGGNNTLFYQDFGGGKFLRIYANGADPFQYCVQTASFDGCGSSFHPVDTYAMFTAVCTTSILRLYHNGVYEGNDYDLSLILTGSNGPAPVFILGSSSVSGGGIDALDGEIGDLRVYDRALSSTDIDEHVAGIYTDGVDLLVHFSFDNRVDDTYESEPYASFFMDNEFGIFLSDPNDPADLPFVDFEAAVFNDFGIFFGDEPEQNSPVPLLFDPEQEGAFFMQELSANEGTIDDTLKMQQAYFTLNIFDHNWEWSTDMLRAPRGSPAFLAAGGNVLDIQNILPMQQAVFDCGIYFQNDMPFQAAQFQLESGAVITLSQALPMSSAVFTEIASQDYVLSSLLLHARANMTLLSSGLITIDGRLIRPSVRLTMVRGNEISITATLPLLNFSAIGYGEYVITISGRLPKPQLEMQLDAFIEEVFNAWAINVRHKERPVTEYGNFNFNSMGRFNGKTIAASKDGLFLLDMQNTDTGKKIDADVITGQNDYGQSMLFRVPRIYVGGSSTKGMEFRTITTADGSRVYRLPQSGNTGTQQRRVPVGRGPKSRYWQYQIKNIDGGDFELASVIVYPEPTQRRVK